MLFKEGDNYLFLKANENSTIRLESRVDPFYSFPVSKVEEIPSLYAETALVPRFLYSTQYNRRTFDSREIRIPKAQDEDMSVKRGSIIEKKDFYLERTPRNQMIATRYLSLRDIVNPNYTEEEVLEEIEKLYFDKKSKSTLFRLVKILYAGKPSEEREIVSNLFAEEKDFAQFLSGQIFRIEILPLIHGIFLQEILTKMDERIIRSGLDRLSPSVYKVVQNSVSKNKFRNILDSPVLEPQKGESLTETIENFIFRRFSRKIYYPEGQYTAYRIPGKERSDRIEKKQAQSSEKFTFLKRKDKMEFLAVDKNKLYFLLKDWTDVFRVDILLNPREWEHREFYRLPPGIILEVPYYPQARSVTGGGIGRDRVDFEFFLSFWEL